LICASHRGTTGPFLASFAPHFQGIYNEESFFVRHAYFLGANDPYSSLKTTLKAEIDPDAWATLNSDISRPFPKPRSGRIAVKVINHLGDEVMQVFRVSKNEHSHPSNRRKQCRCPVPSSILDEVTAGAAVQKPDNCNAKMGLAPIFATGLVR
jgi:hypothetical protein